MVFAVAVVVLLMAAVPARADRVCVHDTLGAGLHIRSTPCTTGAIITTAPEGESFELVQTVKGCDGAQWAQVPTGYAAAQYMQVCGGSLQTWNRFGVGLVSEGQPSQWDLVSNMAGQSVTRTSTTADPSWIQAVAGSYARNLNVIARIGPPWSSSNYRDESDDPQHLNYTTLAAAFRAVVSSLPRTDSRNLYIQVDNEPDLCYEWFCGQAGPTRPYQQTAAEYAHFLRDVIVAIRSIGDPRIRVSLGALSPGGNIQCGCCGQSSCPDDKGGITGLQFLSAMQAAVPDIFTLLDFWASHSYASQGIGWGFNVPFDQGQPGLFYFELELRLINRSLQVLITETGWATQRPGLPACSEQNKADWTVASYRGVWNDTRVMGVTPFMLQDPTWGDQDGFAYVLMNGAQLPVYSAVRALRCGLLGGC